MNQNPRIEDLDNEFNHRNPKVLLQELRIEFSMIKSRSKWKSISETLSFEFNLLRIAKKIKTEEKENCIETLSSEFNLLRIAKKIKTEEKENCV